MSLTASGGVTLAGLEWLGARVYDPAARGFLSTDPLAPVTGAAWSGNPYSYAGNDPLHALDPWGLRPATDADLDAYADANQGAFAAAGEWIGDNWEYLVAGGMVIGGGILMATGVGGPLGLALVSGGLDVGLQKLTTGEVNWAQAAGATVTGAVGGAAWAAGRHAFRAASSAKRVAGAMTVSASANGAVGGVAGAGTYLVKNGFTWNASEFAGSVGSGAVASAVGGLAKPMSGSLKQAARLSLAEGSQSLATRVGQDLVGTTSRFWPTALGAGGGVSGTYIGDRVSGEETTWGGLGWGAATGSIGTLLPGGPVNTTSLQQFARFNPSTLNGTFSGVQATRLWSSAFGGAGVGLGLDGAREVMTRAMGTIR